MMGHVARLTLVRSGARPFLLASLGRVVFSKRLTDFLSSGDISGDVIRLSRSIFIALQEASTPFLDPSHNVQAHFGLGISTQKFVFPLVLENVLAVNNIARMAIA